MCKDLSFLFTNKNPAVIYRDPKNFDNHSHTSIATAIFGSANISNIVSNPYKTDWPEDRMARIEVGKEFYGGKIEFKLDESVVPPWWKESYRRTLFKHGKWHKECRKAVHKAVGYFVWSNDLCVGKVIPGFRGKLNIEATYRTGSGRRRAKIRFPTAILCQNAQDLARQMHRNYNYLAIYSSPKDASKIPSKKTLEASAKILCDLNNDDFFGIIPLERIKMLRERWDREIGILIEEKSL